MNAHVSENSRQRSENPLNPRSLQTKLLLAVMLVALPQIAGANPGADLSHIEARASADSLSHLHVHRPGLPPPALLVPLGDGLDGVLKGHSGSGEARLLDAVRRHRLHQVVLRVAAAEAADRRIGLVKLQAGRRSGDFVIEDLREDAAACLRGTFASSLWFDHLDLWSVVPGPGLVGDIQEHHPVFSVSVPRDDYLEAVSRVGSGTEVIDALPGVRYSPVFTRHAGAAADVNSLPANAFSRAPFSEGWTELLAEAIRSPARNNLPIEAIFSGSTDQGLVALTFDDGPSPLVTPLILQILAREGVRASFFVVGQVVEHFPALTRMIARDGHELANHSYSHRRMIDLSPEEVWAEISACHRIVRAASGQEMRWFRPPGGRSTPEALRTVASLGYRAAFWSQNTGDWNQPSVEQIVRNATAGLQSGDVILMHQVDMRSAEALPLIIAKIREQGLEPVDLSTLAEHGGVIADDPAAVSRVVNGQIAGYQQDANADDETGSFAR